MNKFSKLLHLISVALQEHAQELGHDVVIQIKALEKNVTHQVENEVSKVADQISTIPAVKTAEAVVSAIAPELTQEIEEWAREEWKKHCAEWDSTPMMSEWAIAMWKEKQDRQK